MKPSKKTLEKSHFPVMLEEVIKICQPENGGNFLDCTFGGGGYTKKILGFPGTKVIALDRDSSVENEASKIKKIYPNRFSFFNEKFSNLDKVVGEKNKVDKIIFDLGISTLQLLDNERGFSFKSKGSIDMNMGLADISAEEVLNYYQPHELKIILKYFGEEQEASKIVNNIVRERKIKKIKLVSQLVDIIKKSKKKNYKKKINVATKTFQALRIFVNREITELIEGITKATKCIKSGGNIIIISFHSIEDKIIKFYFKNYSTNKSNPSRYLPEKNKTKDVLFNKYKNTFLTASQQELQENPPSRSAKLRFVTRNENRFKYPEDLKNKFKKYLELEKKYVK